MRRSTRPRHLRNVDVTEPRLTGLTLQPRFNVESRYGCDCADPVRGRSSFYKFNSARFGSAVLDRTLSQSDSAVAAEGSALARVLCQLGRVDHLSELGTRGPLLAS